jgi:hypothetical protein
MPVELPRRRGTEDLQAILSFALGGFANALHLLHFKSVAEAQNLLTSTS